MDFSGDGLLPRSWTCILADNGCGKTTILQAIALAAAGDTLATKLSDDPRTFAPAHNGNLRVAIEADFVRTPGDTFQTRLELVPGSHDWFGVGSEDNQLRSLRSKRQGGFFVAAYGSGRRLSRAGQVAVPADPVLRVCETCSTKSIVSSAWSLAMPFMTSHFDPYSSILSTN